MFNRDQAHAAHTQSIGSALSEFREIAQEIDLYVNPETMARVSEFISHAQSRLQFGAEFTVVAFAGGTGAGKSSLFNAVIGDDVARVAATRPTTSSAQSVSTVAAGPILDYLGVPNRSESAELARTLNLDSSEAPVILVDLPDIDSTESNNRDTAHRLIERVDILIWVLDPQKYADAIIHEDYLRRMTESSEVFLVVVNQIDTLSGESSRAVVADAQRLISADGISTEVFGTSAVTGAGIAQIRNAIAQHVHQRNAAISRLAGEMRDLVQELLNELGQPIYNINEQLAGRKNTSISTRVFHADASARAFAVDKSTVDRTIEAFTSSFARAAGVDDISRAAGESYELRARRSTSWPLTRWLSTKVDPLKVLHLTGVVPTAIEAKSHRASESTIVNPSGGKAGESLKVSREPSKGDLQGNINVHLGSTGYHAPAHIRVSAMNNASKTAKILTSSLPGAWARNETTHFIARTEDALLDTDSLFLGENVEYLRHPVWWRFINFLQWLLVIVGILGVGWLVLLNFADFLQLNIPEPPAWGIIPLPLLILASSVVLGFVLALLSRLVIKRGKKRTEKRVRARLMSTVTDCVTRRILAPTRESIERYEGVMTRLQKLRQIRVFDDKR